MKSRSIALSSLFGVTIFLQKLLLPSPYDKYVSVLLQLLFLSLAFLAAGLAGSVLTGFVSGLLTAMARGGLGAMTLLFAVVYGALVGVFGRALGAMGPKEVRVPRFLASSLAATLITGALSSYTSVALGVFPYEPTLFTAIIAAGAVQGLLGGYLSCIVWRRYLRDLL